MADLSDLRQRIESARDRIVYVHGDRSPTAAEVNERLSGISGDLRAATDVLAEVDELATELAEERIAHQKTTRRAEWAELRLARFRAFLDEDFRFWCSPYGVAGRYANDLLEIFDRDDSEAETPELPYKSKRERILENVARTWEQHARNTKTALFRAFEAAQGPPSRIRDHFSEADAMADYVMAQLESLREARRIQSENIREYRADGARVRKLHFQYRGVSDYDSCAHCNRYAALSGIEVPWPCDTIKALDGEDSRG